MTWEWSHTNEAYAAVEQNIRDMDREKLEVIYAEWRASQDKRGNFQTGTNNFDERKYNRALAYAKKLDLCLLVEAVIEWTSQLRNCTNGGWLAWCCPFGCDTHMVPFDVAVKAEDGD